MHSDKCKYDGLMLQICWAAATVAAETVEQLLQLPLRQLCPVAVAAAAAKGGFKMTCVLILYRVEQRQSVLPLCCHCVSLMVCTCECVCVLSTLQLVQHWYE